MPTSAKANATTSRRAPRVLTVVPDFPFPATTGLHLRHVGNLELIRRLGCYSALLYFSVEGREPLPLEATPLPRLCDEVRHGGRRFLHTDFSTASLVGHKLDFLLRGALGLPGTRYPFSMSYDRIGAQQIIVAEAQRVEADFVVLPSFMVHYAAALQRKGFRVVADAIDVLTELSARLLESYATDKGGRLSLYANHLACGTQERVFLPQCDEIWATSPAEAEMLAAMAPKANVIAVANTLDEDAFLPGALVAGADVGFIGTYSSAPNLQAARFLAEEVFPLLLRKNPGACLKLAGANLPRDKESRLRALGYVDLLGAAADSNEFYSQCRVIALPVFVRGGVPLKLVESMAREKPVVACPELIAGLPVQDGRDVLVCDGAGPFAEAISRLLGDDALCRELGRNGRETFMRNWSRAHAEGVMRRSSVLATAPAQEAYV